MTDAAIDGWQCGTCLVLNANSLSKCAACETPKEPVVYDGPPITFGGGPAASVNVSQPITLIPRTSTLACNTPQATAQAPMPFCKAMTTPISRSEPVFLIGCEPSDLIDKTDCIGYPKVHPGRLKTWGSGECEQLAIKSDLVDEYFGSLKPQAIRAFADRSVIQICCGSLTSYALRENNEVWSWGCPDNGPLGRPVKGVSCEAWEDILPPVEDAQITSGKVPERVWGLPSDDKILKIVAGDSHAGVLTESGDVYIWGHYRDFTGPLGFWNGQENVYTQWTPLKIDLPGVALDIASGENHTVILVQCSSSRCLVVMGSNEFGQLCTTPSVPTLPPKVGGTASVAIDQSNSLLTPIEISPETYIDIRHQYLKPHVIPMGKLMFSLWRKKTNVDGKIVNDFEEMFKLTNGETSPRREELKLTKVCAGSATTFLKVVDGGESMWFACGRGTYGELGGGFCEQAMYNPTLISMPTLCAFDTIGGGDFATFALSSDGSIWAWGKGELCGLGPHVESKILAPKAIPGLRNKCQTVNCGMKTTYALTHAGCVFVWGEGNNYQLGLGANEDLVSIPTRIPPEFFESEAVVDINAGSNHVICLLNEVIERRGAKRARMLDEPDELPSVVKKSRIISEPTQDATSGGLEESLVDRPSLMFLPTAPLSSPQTPQTETIERPRDFSQTPKFPGNETVARLQADTGMADLIQSQMPSNDPEAANIIKPAPIANVFENNQRPTLMPHEDTDVVVDAPEPDQDAEETEGEESVAADPPGESGQTSEVDSSDVEGDHEAGPAAITSRSEVEVDVSVTEPGDPGYQDEWPGLVVPPGTAASSEKLSPREKRATPTQPRLASAAQKETPITKPRDSLTAVLISADRPYDDTPKPSQGEYEPERELEKIVADDGEVDRAAEEEASTTITAKAKSKARAKPKAKGKAKAKAKGRPGRKPKVPAEEEAVAVGQEEEPVAEEAATRRAPVRRARAVRAKTKDEDSMSSVVDSADEEVEVSPSSTTANGAAKKTASGRGRAKAKVKVVNKKK